MCVSRGGGRGEGEGLPAVQSALAVKPLVSKSKKESRCKTFCSVQNDACCSLVFTKKEKKLFCLAKKKRRSKQAWRGRWSSPPCCYTHTNTFCVRQRELITFNSGLFKKPPNNSLGGGGGGVTSAQTLAEQVASLWQEVSLAGSNLRTRLGAVPRLFLGRTQGLAHVPSSSSSCLRCFPVWNPTAERGRRSFPALPAAASAASRFFPTILHFLLHFLLTRHPIRSVVRCLNQQNRPRLLQGLDWAAEHQEALAASFPHHCWSSSLLVSLQEDVKGRPSALSSSRYSSCRPNVA